MVNVCKPCAKILRPPVAAPNHPELLKASLDEIKSAILQHKACLAALEARERETAQRLTRGLIAYPVLTLPNEIVSRIFIQCLPSHGRVRPSRSRAPLLLAQICHHWREIAISTCQLWAAVDIDSDIYRPVASKVERALPLIQTWFSRAMACPLSLTIRSRYHALPMAIYGIISGVAPQLDRLELSLSAEDMGSMQRLSMSLPRLRRLALRFDSGRKLRPASIFPNTPWLRDLDVGESTIAELLLWPNLTTLHLGLISLDQLLQLLQSCYQINDITAQLALAPSTISGPRPFPHLHSLTLFRGKYAQAAVQSLTLPNLRRLELHSTVDSPLFLSFLKRSACALDHLTLGFNYNRTFQDCLATLPSLKSLEVEVNRWTMVHFRGLLDARAVVPRLRTLFMRVDTEDLDYSGFATSLKTRRRHSPDFQFLRLDIHQDSYDDDEGDTQWLPQRAKSLFEDLLADGLQIQVNWESEEGWPERWVDPCETFW